MFVTTFLHSPGEISLLRFLLHFDKSIVDKTDGLSWLGSSANFRDINWHHPNPSPLFISPNQFTSPPQNLLRISQTHRTPNPSIIPNPFISPHQTSYELVCACVLYFSDRNSDIFESFGVGLYMGGRLFVCVGVCVCVWGGGGLLNTVTTRSETLYLILFISRQGGKILMSSPLFS